MAEERPHLNAGGAILQDVSQWTAAGEGPPKVHTCSQGWTWSGETFVYIFFTVLPLPGRGTLTSVVSPVTASLYAASAIVAWVGGADADWCWQCGDGRCGWSWRTSCCSSGIFDSDYTGWCCCVCRRLFILITDGDFHFWHYGLYVNAGCSDRGHLLDGVISGQCWSRSLGNILGGPLRGKTW